MASFVLFFSWLAGIILEKEGWYLDKFLLLFE
jgi:hypothetical protein